ncbi:nuclear body protein SP140-like isoform X2 [Sorex fumeus]|uniref:nuclear body protein SP140-like isoform X2 n=1 Tax=Sorex fumeus TaxID=62283 RepID=UPI0024AD611D|nr:nuclear body protein SP140-like isoform X2 [Sorex fumeus]
MDGADGQLSTSILSENQDTDNIPLLADRLRNTFKANKTRIAFAITKTFPFLETLRDNELITENIYKELQSNEKKGVGAFQVVYCALQAVEEKFHPQHLNILFNEVHRTVYPNLQPVFETLKNEIQKITCLQDGSEQDALVGSAGSLSLEQGTVENLQECLISASQNADTSNGTTVHASGFLEHLLDTGALWEGTPGGERNVLENVQDSDHCAQEPERAGEELHKHAIQSSPCFVSLVDIKKEKPSSSSKARCNQSSEIIDLSSDDEPTDISGGEETREVSTSPLKRGIDATDLRKSPVFRIRHFKRVRRIESFSGSSGDEAPQMFDAMDEDSEDIGNKSNCTTDNQEREFHSDDSTELILREEPQETCSSALRRASEGMTRGQETRTGNGGASSKTDATASGSNSVWREYNWRKNLAIKYKASRAQGRRQSNIKLLKKKLKRRKRGLRTRKDRNMNFDVPELPVTCGEVKGTLYKEKFKIGTSSKCILRENGEAWLTLREFEIEGGRGSWKNWRLSVRCGGWTLKELIKKNLLPNPPRSRRRPENSNVCVVCCRSGTLFCCDSCPRSFHKRCHIQYINPKRDPWFCIFCSVQNIQENSSQNQSYRESEVLIWPMDYRNDLKCKFLLLMLYSYFKSSFYVQEPYHGIMHTPGDYRSKCLNTIRQKLRQKKYMQVGAFVRDMRHIVESHKTFFEDQSVIILGFQLEKQFEDNFKAIFAIQ